MGRSGSSPLARGLRGAGVRVHRSGRIIPARAGFTPIPSAFGTFVPDHPRSRGAYETMGFSHNFVGGSSPLARGLPPVRAGEARYLGIIPARAGFTLLRRFPYAHAWDHPRSRGVYSSSLPWVGAHSGSSPLARGLPGGVEPPGPVRGIIPARAGFTRSWAVTMGVPKDHPRSRGVYPRPGGTDRPRPRIIPARAGFTPKIALGVPITGDHPRSRGVY